MKAFYALGDSKYGCELTLPQSTLLSDGKWELAIASIIYIGSFDAASPIVIQANICHSDYISFDNVQVDCKTILQQQKLQKKYPAIYISSSVELPDKNEKQCTKGTAY